MKKHAINFSWPACLSDFSKDTAQENFSRGKLKVFYKGETADHRYFSDSFSKELIKSLPYTPVVSYYDEEKDDFVGHATQQQILGIVDPCVEPSFEQDEDGVDWCVCDVVLYTERPDKVGDLAKKIVGHKQSLELDPSSVKYIINYDEKRHFKNIEFTAGKFVGVSVLGSDQKPAFTGSEFFSYNEQFENKMKLLREYCESKHDQINDGGNKMNLQEFMKLSWGDISVKVEEAIYTEYQEEAFTQIVDMFDDCAIVRFYSYIDGSCKLIRVRYTCDDNGVVTLGIVNEVHVTYEDIKTAIEETGVEQATELPNIKPSDEPKEKSDADDFKKGCNAESSEPDDEEKQDKEDNEFKDEDSKEPSNDKTDDVVDAACADAATDAAQVTNAEVTETNEKVSVENEQIKEEDSSTTSFAESERAEFEALKREKKIDLLNSYKEYLTDEEYGDFESRIDTFEVDTLEVELLKKYKSHTERTPQKTMRAFALTSQQNENARNPLDDFVRKNLNR